MLGIIRRRASVAGGEESIPANEIHYEALAKYSLWDSSSETREHEHVVSHTFEDGKGIIVFDHDLEIFPSIFLEDEDYEESLRVVKMSDNITSLAIGALRQHSYLECVRLSQNITAIPWDTFRGCESLTDIQLPDSITYIDGWAFQDCINLDLPKLPDSLIEVGQDAFTNCESLRIDALPNGLQYIRDRAFSYTGVTISVIPASVERIHDGAFYECNSMPTSVTLLKEHPGMYDFYVKGDSFREDISFFVDADSLADYEANYYWNKYYSGRIFAIPE